ncbi:MAG: phage holin family protein [Lachnospiraceae bacterium]|nr:phage holin family protein [Lachnospiraceae bacterium]MDE6253336.1 phage holin family protein [Lachnospiraceae bacterium]
MNEFKYRLNLKVRLRNPVFIMQVILAIFTPILAYAGLTAQDLTTWKALIDLITGAVRNPYVLGLCVVSVWNAINDPTTAGLGDSSNALTYIEPKIND